jgi:hypothetical protein
MSHCDADPQTTRLLLEPPPKEQLMNTVRIATVAATLAVAGAALIGTPAASAKGGDGVKVRGVCTKSSSAKLKLSREDRGIQIEFEVDQNRNAVPWKVTLQRNGSLIASATATTHAPSLVRVPPRLVRCRHARRLGDPGGRALHRHRHDLGI